MGHQFKMHYTREEARSLLPEVRQWLQRLVHLRDQLHTCDQRLSTLIESGNDAGGEVVNHWVRVMAESREVLLEFQQREILIKDLDRGLVDFPAIVGGKEVFLCWEKDEDDIEYWHDLDAGYAGREKL